MHVNGFDSSEGVVLPVRHGRFSGCPFHMLVMACPKVDARTHSALGTCRISLLVAQGCSGPIRISLAHLSALGNPIGTTLEHNCVTTLCVRACWIALVGGSVGKLRPHAQLYRHFAPVWSPLLWHFGIARATLSALRDTLCVCVSLCWVGLVMARW